jgi:tRNA U38,U39,U40 pseudouridine synthase TruA
MKMIAFVVATMALGGTAAAQKRMEDIKPPAKTASFTSWTAAQQWMQQVGHGSDPRFEYGYSSLQGALLLADELGDRLSALGRASLIEKCFKHLKPETTSTLAWAMCGPDVEALDLKKVEAELSAEGIGGDSRKTVMDDITTAYTSAKKIGEAVNAAAKTDPGVAAVLKAAQTARAEWAAYASKNKPAIDRYLALKDAVRSGKSNDKGFDGCYEATLPAFAKLVKAAKLPVEVDAHPMLTYVSALTTTIDGYVTTVSYAACAWAQSKAGESIYVGAANRAGGDLRFGARSLALSKVFDPAFKPKFAERALSLDTMRSQWKHGVEMSGVLDRAAIMTPGGAVVATVAKEADVVKVTFKGGTVDRCLAWKDTNRIAQITPNGTISYEKVCLRRGQVASTASPVEVPAKYAVGIAPGVEIVTVLDFPVIVRKGGKLVSVLGVAK